MRKIKGLPQWLLALVATAITIACLLLSAFVVKFGLNPSDSQETWGQFGDFLGGILNPLFSIIGLLALLHTIVLQVKELKRSTKELKASAKALKKQNKHNAKQQFSSAFFQLIALNRTQANLATYGYGKKHVGEEAFHVAMLDFIRGWDLNNSEAPQYLDKYISWYQNGGNKFDGYCHSVANMIAFVVDANVPKSLKQFAFGTISSNLSDSELSVFLLFATFSPHHSWVRETLIEEKFFDTCQMDYLNPIGLWNLIGDFCFID